MADVPQARVLVVDDDPGVRTLVSTILQRANCDVSTAADGSEAIEKLREDEGFDLILLDLMMPKVDGLGVYAHLRAHQPKVAERVVVMTAFPTAAVQRIGFSAPILPKPFDIQNLLEIVKSHSTAAA